jgi:hypothetical protein
MRGPALQKQEPKASFSKVIAVNVRENDSAQTGMLLNPRSRPDVQLNLAAFAIDLVANEVVIME